jgi:hypothetical protein
LADEIIFHIRNFPDRVYTNETRLDGFYLNEINNSTHNTVLNSFFPVKTEAKGDWKWMSIGCHQILDSG